MKIKQHYRSFLLFSLCLLSGCHRKPIEPPCKKTLICTKPTSQAQQTSFTNNNPEQPTITIWIHGTSVFFSKFIYPNFFYTRRGLHAATTFDSKYHLREIAELLQKNDSQNFPIDHMYFYGWSGKLSFKSRYKSAKKLYVELINLVDTYKETHNIQPKLRIITHSHGGNVALNMARYNQDLRLQIEELILLACPVQERTKYLIEHLTFKNIYSLYSRFDSFQIIDPQRVYYWLKKDLAEYDSIKPDSFFSQRKFPINEKIYQIQLKLNNRGIMHIEFLTNKFVRNLPRIMDEIKSSYQQEGNTKAMQFNLVT